MKELFEQLDKIKSLLEQIYAITQNQMTVLIDSNYGELEMIEEMATYKQNLTLDVENVEKCFQQGYNQWKTQLAEKNLMPSLQTKVGYILKLKEDIIANEQKNVLLLEEARRRYVERVELPIDPAKVAEAYRQHTKTIK